MKTPTFYIQLDQPIRSFFPGQGISGKVVVTCDKPKDLKFISITFEGLGKVHWTETQRITTGHGKNRRTTTRTVLFTAREDYFSCKIMLLGNENSTITLPTGTTGFPFQFTLPLNLPSSYTSKIGVVHYLMEARMKRSWYKADQTAIVPFTVNGILDLNLEPGVSQSKCVEKYKNVCCLCCKSGPVGYKIALQRSGFVPGEFAQFNAEFLNNSRRKIERVTLSLVQTSSYHANGKSTSRSKVVGSVSSPAIEAGDSDFWGGEVLRIPPVPPTRLAGCRIIDVQYSLKFELDIKGLTMNMTAEIPICIGTIPFRNTFTDFMPGIGGLGQPQSQWNQLSVENLPGFSGHFGQVPAGQVVPTAPVFDMYPDLPPPSYAEAMQSEKFERIVEGNGNEGEEEMRKNDGFVRDEEDAKGQGESSRSVPSAPPEYDYDYVPNYVTYGYASKEK